MNLKDTKLLVFCTGFGKKAVIPLAFFILFASVASAISIDLPSQTPAKIAFLFSVELPETSSFTQSQVFYDNKLIITALNDGSVNIDSENGKFILKAFIEGDTSPRLYVSYVENSAGTHSIMAHSFNGTKIDQTNESFEVTSEFSSSSGEIDSLVSQVSSLETSLSSMQSNIETLNSDFGSVESSTQQTVQQTTEQLTSNLQKVQNKIKLLKNQVEGTNKTGTISIIQQNVLQKRLDSLEEKIKTTGKELDLAKKEIDLQKQKIISLIKPEETENFSTGVFSLATKSVPVLVIMTIALFTALFLFAKKFKRKKLGEI